MNSPIEEVLMFLDEWETVSEMRDSFLRRFTPTTIWENVGASHTVGAEAAVALLDGLNAQAGITTGKIAVHNIAADGSTVYTERIDFFYRADGSEVCAIRVMGIFEMDGPKILAWREYFDPRGLMG